MRLFFCSIPGRQARYDAGNPIALKQAAGAKVKLLPCCLAAFSETGARPVVQSVEGAVCRTRVEQSRTEKNYGDYRAFQKDQILWFRFAESRIDQYMQGVTL